MLNWLDRLVDAISQRKPLAVGLLVAVALIAVAVAVGTIVPNIISANATSKTAQYATAASVFLDCARDARVTKTSGEHGPLPNRVLYLDYGALMDEKMGGLTKYDADGNIIEIHNTFERCRLTNDGSINLHNIKVVFNFHGYGPYENLVTSYPYTVAVPELATGGRATFGITSRVPLLFAVLPPTSATAQTVLTQADEAIHFGESDHTRHMEYDGLLPSFPRKTAWKLSPCHFEGSGVMHNGKITIKLPKSCYGATAANLPPKP